MKSKVWTVMQKELARFFKDPRMVFSALLLPGLLIYVLYSFMGTAMANAFTAKEDSITVYGQNVPQSILDDLQKTGVAVKPAEDIEALRADIEAQEAELLLCFPADFENAIAAYDVTAGGAAPNVEVYYNSASTGSQTAYSLVGGVLDAYESARSNLFDVNAGAGTYDLASERDMTGKVFSMMLPMILMAMLFSSCMAVAAESIAGEKERGTIAALLVTPMRRNDLAVGKILSLSFISMLGGLSSGLGTILSLPKMMGGATGEMEFAAYSIGDYLWLLLVILSTVLLLVAAISVISAFAKSVKEATTLVMPLMIVAMLIGVTGMFGNGAATDTVMYLIPLYNTVQSMTGIFLFEANTVHLLVMCGSNLVVTAALAFVLTKMMSSERVMFQR